MVMLLDDVQPSPLEVVPLTPAAGRTPEEWITTLWKRLDARAERIRLFEDYYQGIQRLRFTTLKMREVFGHEFGAFADNFCLLVVDAVEERLRITGFRVLDDGDSPAEEAAESPDEEAAEDETAEASITNDEAWRIWRANDMEAVSSMAHNAALVGECAYVIVWENPDDPSTPLMSAESPLQVITDEGRERRAALKRWIDDDDGHWRAELYLPDALYKFRSRLTAKQAKNPANPRFWEQFLDDGDTGWPIDNPLNEVPVVPLPNSPRLGPGQTAISELASVIPIQDAINKMVMDTLIASEFVAYPQRVMINVTIPKDEQDQPLEPFKAGVNRVWFVQNAEGQGGLNPSVTQFPSADLTPYVGVVEMLVQHVASITKTPPHYLLGQSGAFPSGETLKATETGLVAKAKRKMRVFGDGWEEVMSLAFRWQKKAGITVPTTQEEDIQVQWADPESRTEAQHIDALLKLGTLDVPTEQLWLDAGYTPQDVGRFKAMRAASPPPMMPVRSTEPVTPQQIEAEAPNSGEGLKLPIVPTNSPPTPTPPMAPMRRRGPNA